MMRLKDRKGFTLTEVLVVVAIVAVLIAVGVPVMAPAVGKAKDATCLANRTSLGRECSYAIMYEPNNSDAAVRTRLVQEIMDKHKGDQMCPLGGKYTASIFKAANVGGNSDSKAEGAVWQVHILCDKHMTEWALGQTYKVGDVMYSNNFILECIRAHTTGTTSRTRNPTLRSNKSSWEVVGTVDGSTPNYSSTVRFAEGMRVIYNGNIYERTRFNLVGGQVPYNGVDSDYWIFVGPAPTTP